MRKKSSILVVIMIFREQDKEWGKIAVTRQISTLSKCFAKWETHLARTKKARLLACLAPATGIEPVTTP